MNITETVLVLVNGLVFTENVSMLMPCHQNARHSHNIKMTIKFFDNVASSSKLLGKDASKSKLLI
jgi:hypothetical protein